MEHLFVLWDRLIFVGCYFVLSVAFILATFGIFLTVRFIHRWLYKNIPGYKLFIDF